jgi:hypothetical protein
MFKLYGSGQSGLKVDDLNQYETLINSLGMKIPAGVVIQTGVFLQLIQDLGLEEDDAPELLVNTRCPEYIERINSEILSELKVGGAYAIRSSALSERGGTGIYHSAFFVPSGNVDRDMECLWEREKEVYASEYSYDAKAWRKKNHAEIGMAILIQEVCGYKFEGKCLPALAGVAYTTYQGLPTVRTVVGLGSKAVSGEGLVYNIPPDDPLQLSRDLWEQEIAAAVDLLSGKIAGLSSQYQETCCAISFKAFCLLFEKISELKKHGAFSVEWAIVDEDIYVVQIAPYDDVLPGDMTIDKDKYFLLAQGTDVLHSGRCSCKGIVRVNKWSNEAACVLKDLNEKLSGYLLIAPQDAFSLLARLGDDPETGEPNVQINFHHFSNASGVLEWQHPYSVEDKRRAFSLGIRLADHTRNMGASHFQQLCSRSDILYLGASFKEDTLIPLSGVMRYPAGVMVWETEAVMLVDAVKKEGYVYVSKESKDNKYSPQQLSDWSMQLRDVANRLNGLPESQDLANHFYIVHYAIGNEDSPLDFDPFRLDPEIAEERGDEGMVESINAVITEIDRVELPPDLKVYLGELLTHLKH